MSDEMIRTYYARAATAGERRKMLITIAELCACPTCDICRIVGAEPELPGFASKRGRRYCMPREAYDHIIQLYRAGVKLTDISSLIESYYGHQYGKAAVTCLIRSARRAGFDLPMRYRIKEREK